MNWKEISKNWRSFIEENGLYESAEENQYFYGKQEIREAQEDFKGFRIIYKNKLNKPATPTALRNNVNSFSITTLVTTDSKWTFRIKTKSYWKRIFSSTANLKIGTNLEDYKRLLPLSSIESLSKEFADLEVSILKYSNFQTDETAHDTAIVKITTRIQPEKLALLQSARLLMHSILQNLQKENKIKPAHNNDLS